MFSRLDESLDEVYIPWYDGRSNRMRQFKPDFIFWLERDDEYFIVFIDPKGTEHTDYQRKSDGYAAIFEEAGGAKKTITCNHSKARVFTFLHTADVGGLPSAYRDYWFNDIGFVLESVLASA